MKNSLETALLSHLTRARAFGHTEATWLATRVLASRMNEGQICAALVRLEAMLANPTTLPLRPGVVACRAILTPSQETIHFGDSK